MATRHVVPDRHKKKRVRERDKVLELEARAAAAGQLPARRSNLQGWLANTTGPQLGDFYIDARGDRDNLLYHGLYRNDIAAYRRFDPGRLAPPPQRVCYAPGCVAGCVVW